MSRKSGSKGKARAGEGPAGGSQGADPEPQAGPALHRRLPGWWPVPLFMVVGLYFRLATTLWQPLIYPDSMQYMYLAGEIRSGVFFGKDYDLDQGFIKSRRVPPLYSILLAPFAGTEADLETVGIVISLVMSTLTFIPLYWGTLLIFSRRAALIACALFSFQAFALFFASPILTEATFTFIFACVIAVSAWALSRPGAWRFATCGVLSALLYLTRDVGITAAPLIAAGALIKLKFLDRVSWKRTASLVGVLLGSFLLVSAPYFAHIRLRTGHWGLTAQMSNTSVTRQIQLEGGDRYDRDRTRGVEPTLVGKKEARGLAGLVKMSPQLLLKVVRNMGKYGLSGEQRFKPFLLAFLLFGCWALVHDFRSGHDRDRLFLALWVAAWILDLWALYSLVTPYMVDERYMYPLTVPALMLAATGIAQAADSFPAVLRRDEEGPLAGSMALALALLALCALYVRELPALLYKDAFDGWTTAYPNLPDLALLFPVFGAAVLFTLAAAPSVRLALGPALAWSGKKRQLGALAALLVAVGLVASILARTDAGYLRSLPGLILLGAGLGLAATLALARGGGSPARWPAFLSAFLVAAAFISQAPDYEDIRVRRSSDTLSSKYASGHKEAAEDIKRLHLIPPGKVISERKPFMSFYLHGKLYLDEDQEPIPKTVPEVEALIKSGAVDYLVADSFTFKALRPYLTGLAFAVKPLKGASVIYSRFFPQYDRVITVYDCHRPDTGAPQRASAQDYLAAARAYYDASNLVFAYRELNRALELDPRDRGALRLKIQILLIYYQCASRPHVPTIAMAPDVLPALIEAAQDYLRLAPDNEEAKSIYSAVTQYYRSEMHLIKAYEQARQGNQPKITEKQPVP